MWMKKSLIDHFISHERFSAYKDLDEYRENLTFSKQSYIPLSILEVSLRNAIDQHLSIKVGAEWYLDNSFLTKDSKEKVDQAIALLSKRREPITKQKIIAELSLGFWVNLFKKPYDKKLRINDLVKIFPNLPPRNILFVNRELLYKKLDHIRNFRNRVFHYEKVVNKNSYTAVFNDIDTVLGYFDEEINEFTKKANQ
jgi:hypothetical protein